MNINDLIDTIDDIVFVDKKNRYNITMIYNYKSDIKWDESIPIKKTKLLNYSDWRLPTLSELKWICKQKGLLSSLKPKYKHTYTTLDHRWIWSKTETDMEHALMVCGNRMEIKDKCVHADVIYIR